MRQTGWRPLLLLLVLFLSSSIAAEDPPIGVLLRKDPTTLDVQTTGSSLFLVWGPEEEAILSTDAHRITFSGSQAQLGQWRFEARPFRLRSSGNSPTRVAGNRYEGWIEFLPTTGQKAGWQVVNRVPLERYLLGVLPREMPASFPPAALEAQAIAARTYALYQIVTRAPGTRVHLFSDVRSQVYGGVTQSIQEMEQAVAGTRGQVLFYQGKIFEAFYHSTCGGYTQSALAAFGGPDLPTLQPVPCGFCKDSRYYTPWRFSLTRADVQRILKPICKEYRLKLGKVQAILPVERGPGQHAAYLRIDHDHGSFEVDAALFREACRQLRLDGPRSTAFRCRQEGAGFLLEGVGWGHGVGLCQFGASGLAKQGLNAQEILQHYYPGSQVVELW
ncbi:MAG: SpoIID/LytB domain-containing protein [Planctomycetota bacterium]